MKKEKKNYSRTEYYASEVKQLKELINSKHREKLKAVVLLLQDYEPVHITQVTITETANCGFNLLNPSSLLNRIRSI